MSLTTLNDLDRTTVGEVLAAAALLSAPNAGDYEVEPTIKERAVKVLGEVRERVSVTPADQSDKARTLIDNFLSKAIQSAVFPADQIGPALARAGEMGRLSPAAYRIVQPQSFEKTFREWVSKKAVQDAVHLPDDFEHLWVASAKPEERDTLSLFMKQVGATRSKSAHWLLVQCVRQEVSQIVQSAWRIYPSDVDLSEASRPLEVLRAFAEAFGVPIRIGTRESKFIETEVMLRDGENVPVNFELGIPVGDVFASYSFQSGVNPTVMNVGIAYCIDLPKYRAAIQRHL